MVDGGTIDHDARSDARDANTRIQNHERQCEEREQRTGERFAEVVHSVKNLDQRVSAGNIRMHDRLDAIVKVLVLLVISGFGSIVLFLADRFFK